MLECMAVSHSQYLLSKIAGTWEKRARVKHYLLPNETTYEIEKPDFLESLIPIQHCHGYQTLPYDVKEKILSYAWLAYNAKTIAIESKIISPVCYDIIDGHIPGADDNDSKLLISETLTDESYHVLLCQHAMSITEKHRNINRNIFSHFDLIKKMTQLEKQYSEEWQKKLIQLAVAIVSEVFISDYLKVMSSASEVPTLNREIVRTHRMDEMIHGRIFHALSKKIYSALSQTQKDFFASIFHYPVFYFASKELSIWNDILDVCCKEYRKKIMDELTASAWFDLSNLNYQELISLAEEMGIGDFKEQIAHLKRNAL